jgi:hypothetical protein
MPKITAETVKLARQEERERCLRILVHHADWWNKRAAASSEAHSVSMELEKLIIEVKGK